jgi:hypothetical protein
VVAGFDIDSSMQGCCQVCTPRSPAVHQFILNQLGNSRPEISSRKLQYTQQAVAAVLPELI